MDLRKAILDSEGKDDVKAIADYIGTDTDRFHELMQLFLYDEWRVCQLSGWVLSKCTDMHIRMILPYIGEMVKNLRKPSHDAVKRNTLRIFQNIEIPEAQFGEVIDLCFGFLANPQEPIAMRVFSMTVLHNACKREPDLSNELRLLIDAHMEDASAGFKSRGRKILKALEREQKQRR